MSDLEVFQDLVKYVNRLMFGYKKTRARTKKGKYRADDPTTKNINEAWEYK